MGRVYLLLPLLLAAAVAVTVAQRPLATAPGADLVSAYVDGELPITDVSAALWQEATALDVPLSAQVMVPPLNLSPSVNSVRIRSLNNGQWIAFLLEWQDGARDIGGGVAAYRDSVAIQFPTKKGEPFVCMGMSDAGVHILHWRADFQADVEQGYPDIKDFFPNLTVSFYPHEDISTFITAQAAGNPLAQPARLSPVEDLTAAGFGTLESQPQADAAGWGVWESGKWKAIIARPLTTGDPMDAQFKNGDVTSLAVAVWDGGHGEVDGKKAVSAWVNLSIEAIEAKDGFPASIIAILAVAGAVALMGVAFLLARLVRRRPQ